MSKSEVRSLSFIDYISPGTASSLWMSAVMRDMRRVLQADTGPNCCDQWLHDCVLDITVMTLNEAIGLRMVNRSNMLDTGSADIWLTNSWSLIWILHNHGCSIVLQDICLGSRGKVVMQPWSRRDTDWHYVLPISKIIFRVFWLEMWFWIICGYWWNKLYRYHQIPCEHSEWCVVAALWDHE